MSKNNLIKGTAVLTIAGLITRFFGFFYRIYLSNSMGAERMGIYQLVFPIYAICFTIYASGIQTSLSRLVATELGRKHYKNTKKLLWITLTLSVSLALFLSIIVFRYSDFIAAKILTEPRCASSLRILACIFPFCGITSCINGYYYGLKKAGVPASTQLLEQIVRVISVYFIAKFYGKGDLKVTCEMAVIGLVAGEIASNLYNVISLFCTSSARDISHLAKSDQNPSKRKRLITKDLLKMGVPLTANRLLINILHSFEAILIPNMLKLYGLSSSEALSIYGILTGMSVPFIMFPSAVTNSLAVLLLPTISEAQASGKNTLIQKTTALSIKYSVLIGILSAGIFISFGKELGNLIFHNSLAGSFLITLAWLCPFLYLTTTLSSIINGLGLAHLTFTNSIISSLAQILMILYLVPRTGITGYLISLLISQLIVTALDGLVVIKNIKPPFEADNLLLKPGIIITFLSYLLYRVYKYISPVHGGLIVLLLFCLLLFILYTIFLAITKSIALRDFK